MSLGVLFVLICLVGSCHAQLFTCSDNVTLCAIVLESCCCAPAIACSCCTSSQVCLSNSTCVVASVSSSPTLSNSLSPTNSPPSTVSLSPTISLSSTVSLSPTISLPPTVSLSPTISRTISTSPIVSGCILLDVSTLTCTTALPPGRTILSPNITVVVGDLEVGSGSTIVLAQPILVQAGTAAIDGNIEIDLSGQALSADGFVAVVRTGDNGQLMIGSNATITALALPGAARPCERIVQHGSATRNGGTEFGALLAVDKSGCHSHADRVPMIVGISVGVAVFCACLIVAIVGATTVLCWGRIAPHLWKTEEINMDSEEIRASR